MNTADELIAKGTDLELQGANFLDRDGNFAKQSLKGVAKVEFIFIDGERLTLPPDEFLKLENSGFEFKLRPKENDA